MGKPRGGSCTDCPSVCSRGKTEWVDFRNQGEKDGEIWRQILKNKRGKQRKNLRLAFNFEGRTNGVPFIKAEIVLGHLIAKVQNLHAGSYSYFNIPYSKFDKNKCSLVMYFVYKNSLQCLLHK